MYLCQQAGECILVVRGPNVCELGYEIWTGLQLL